MASGGDEEKGGMKTTKGGGDHSSQTIRVEGGKVGAPQPIPSTPDPTATQEAQQPQPEQAEQEVPLEKQPAPVALPGMPDNSTATPGFTDVPPEPIKQEQAERERAASGAQSAEQP